MTTTPLPPLPVTEHNHPEHHWRWTPLEIRWMDARDAQWQAYATQARADLEAENARLRGALQIAHNHIDMNALRVSHCKDAATITAALKEQP